MQVGISPLHSQFLRILTEWNNCGYHCSLFHHCKRTVLGIHNICWYLDWEIFWKGRPITTSVLERIKLNPMWTLQCWSWVCAIQRKSIASVFPCLCLLDGHHLCEIGFSILSCCLSHLTSAPTFPPSKVGKIWDQSIVYTCSLYFYYSAISTRHSDRCENGYQFYM